MPEWSRAAPAEVGMDASLLEKARDYALEGEGSGYITRRGRLAFSWGDPKRLYDLKSSTKSFGATALGLAIGDGKMKLTDRAVAYQPSLGNPPPENLQTGWIDKITIFHLATQTAGFDKPGGYTKLLFEPGTKWSYSDGGPNWLAECITLVYKRDLAELMFERVFTPLGIRPEDLTWRKNAYREAKIEGIPRREFGSGILCVRGTLYLWARNAGNAQLAWSADHGRAWTWSPWRFTTSFGCPTFLAFGKDYAGARDEYVYVYSFDSASAYEPADRMVLARVPAARITEQAAYEYFVRLGGDGRPEWSADIARRGAVFDHRGRCYRSGISYNAGLKRYLWWQVTGGGAGAVKGGFGVYDAPEPWGPWTTAYFTEQWDVGPGESGSFPTKWISPDGRTVHLVFSGDDAFSVRRATLELKARIAP